MDRFPHTFRAIRPLFLALLCPVLLAAAEPGFFQFPPAHAWQGNGVASPVRFTGESNARLSATFLGSTSGKRATWDIPLGHRDLRHTAAIRLRMRTTCPELVSEAVLHIKAGNCWYSAPFELPQPGVWREIQIPRSDLLPENGTASWEDCSILRLALWHGSPGQATIELSQLAFIPPNVPFAILRGKSASPKANDGRRYAAGLSHALGRIGIYPAYLQPEECGTSTLAPYHLLFLPFPECLTAPQQDAVVRHISRGRKIFLFHEVPPAIASAMRLPPAKFAYAKDTVSGGFSGLQPTSPNTDTPPLQQNSGVFLQVTTLPPHCRTEAVWRNAYGKTTSLPALLSLPGGYWMTHVYLDQDTTNGGPFFCGMLRKELPQLPAIACTELLRQCHLLLPSGSPSQQANARRLLSLAKTSYEMKNIFQAIRLLQQTQESLLLPEPTVRSAEAVPDEIRGAWCRLAAGIGGYSWKDILPRMHGCGLNALFLHAVSPYETAYSSSLGTRTIPQAPSPAAFEELCRKNGIRLHLWINCLNVTEAPPAMRQKWQKEKRLQKNSKGDVLPWLCPNSAENIRFLARLSQESALKYRTAGIHFDFIRYPQTDSCYCEHCREAFCRYLHVNRLPDWPHCTMPGKTRYAAWCQFRQNSISNLLQKMAESIRAVRTDTVFSAAVFPEPALARTNVGQNWTYWLQRKWLDYACPMNYRGSSTAFSGDIARQLRDAGQPQKLLPGIGVSVNHLTPSAVDAQVQTARKMHTAGFLLFDLNQRELREILPACRSLPKSQ